MFALIAPQEGNRICQIESDTFEVAPPLFWAECPPEATTAWTYENGAFVPPPSEGIP